MTASTSTSLYCDRDTRPPVDGIRTICGIEFGPAAMTVDQLRHIARDYGWAHTGLSDFCPAHKVARRQDTGT